MGMDLWYDIAIQELADADDRTTDLLDDAENALAPEPTAETDE